MTLDNSNLGQNGAPGRPETPPTGPLIDALLDGDLSDERSREVLRLIRQDAQACEDLARTRVAVDSLRTPLDVPDLSEAILGKVHARRRFLPGRSRRLVTAGRLAVAAGFIGAIGIASLVQRHVPAVRLADEPTPVTRIVEAAAPKAIDRPALTDQTVEKIKASLGSGSTGPSVGRLTLSPRIRLGDQLHYDLAIDRESGVVWSITSCDSFAAIPSAAGDAGAGRIAESAPNIVVVGPSALVGGAERPEPAAAEPSPLLSRFRPLMMYLREPPKLTEGDSAESDR
ncbi:MAG: anti-sigma factor family protein [Phycisphaerales bacterium JB054]